MTHRAESGDRRSRIVSLCALLVAFNLIAWALAVFTFPDHLVLIGTALLACAFGLRYAVDADHCDLERLQAAVGLGETASAAASS